MPESLTWTLNTPIKTVFPHQLLETLLSAGTSVKSQPVLSCGEASIRPSLRLSWCGNGCQPCTQQPRKSRSPAVFAQNSLWKTSSKRKRQHALVSFEPSSYALPLPPSAGEDFSNINIMMLLRALFLIVLSIHKCVRCDSLQSRSQQWRQWHVQWLH